MENAQTAATPAAQSAERALATIAVNQFVTREAAPEMLDGFEDLSLPPIIKSKGLQLGDIIYGEIDSFHEYDDGKNIKTALITIHVLRPNPATKSLERLGLRGSLPVGAVLQRALGAAELGPKALPSDINAKIQANGFGKGTILAMRYNGTGKERQNQNAPHLWDIKAKKPSGETIAVGVDHGNKKGEKVNAK